MELRNITDNIKLYKGKVRDVYYSDDKIFLLASNRISAFDCILPKEIPFKGAVLNLLSSHLLKLTKDIVPNWLVDSPLPNLSWGHKCRALPIEVIVRGYICGSMWRKYSEGETVFCGNILKQNLRKNEKLDTPIITPTTKSQFGHDQDTSSEELIVKNIVNAETWQLISKYALDLFEFGSKYALEKGLILVDTKLEFGFDDKGKLLLIDEILTPDSSRYFEFDDYEKSIKENIEPIQLSKEFVREYLINNNFMNRPNDIMPIMDDNIIDSISEKYITLYERIISEKFERQKCNEKKDFDIVELINNICKTSNKI